MHFDPSILKCAFGITPLPAIYFWQEAVHTPENLTLDLAYA